MDKVYILESIERGEVIAVRPTEKEAELALAKVSSRLEQHGINPGSYSFQIREYDFQDTFINKLY